MTICIVRQNLYKFYIKLKKKKINRFSLLFCFLEIRGCEIYLGSRLRHFSDYDVNGLRTRWINWWLSLLSEMVKIVKSIHRLTKIKYYVSIRVILIFFTFRKKSDSFLNNPQPYYTKCWYFSLQKFFVVLHMKRMMQNFQKPPFCAAANRWSRFFKIFGKKSFF